MKNAIIEVYGNRTKATDENIKLEELAEILKHKRKMACMTGDHGRFCIKGLPAGKYLLRAGTNGESEFSGADVVVMLDRRGNQSSNQELRVDLVISH